MGNPSVLFTGKGGKSGSWAIRGCQLGEIGTVIPHCTDPKGFDVALVVKRTPQPVIQALRYYNVPWVWDVVDCYPQPHANLWTKAEAINWIHTQIIRAQPDGIIWPNRKMMEDMDVNIPQTVLYHHHRPGIKPNPIRPDVKIVGYEGGDYLGIYRRTLERECDKRGWRFTVTPEHLADVDIVVALRDPTGYVPFSWKSNVKLANAHGSGTPFIGNPENGYIETQTGAEYWAEDPSQIGRCFDWLSDQGTRELVSTRFRDAAYPLEQAQKDLREFLCRFK